MNIVEYLKSSFLATESTVRKYIATSPYRYKTYSIPKRNSRGVRKIAQPSKELKIIQRSVLAEFLSDLPVHDCATAYVKGRGIKYNACQHRKNDFLLKMDFKDFFPSIKPGDLEKHIKKYKHDQFTLDDIEIIKRLFFYRVKRGAEKVLSIGAPSSPFISNTIMYDIDLMVNNFCIENEIVYTRYADDITFSCSVKGVLYQVPVVVEGILKSAKYPNLRLNYEKTIFSSKADNRHITGLVISNRNKVSIGRSKKRYVRGLVFKCLNGLLDEKAE